MEFWVILVAFRQWKNDFAGFLDARALKTLQKQVFWTDVIAKNV